MSVLVTGAGGFIGSQLTEALLHGDHAVRALVRYNGRNHWGHLDHLRSQPPTNLDVRLGDITDPFLVQDVVSGCDTVFHLAALIGIPYSYVAPQSYIATNVVGTLNVLQAARAFGVRRTVVTSTSEVYGTAQYVPIDESHPLHAQSPYSASKIGADKLAESFAASFNLPVVILRPFNTFGPRQSARAVIPTVLSQAMAGADEIVLGNITPRRDLTYVDDTVRAFILAAQAPSIEGETIHFGNGRAISVEDLAILCLRIVGSNARIVSDDNRRRPEGSEVDVLVADAAKAQRLLHWNPSVTLSDGLERTATYMRHHGNHYQPRMYVT